MGVTHREHDDLLDDHVGRRRGDGTGGRRRPDRWGDEPRRRAVDGPPAGTLTDTGDAAPFTDAGGGCTIADPTGTGGCVTPATAWLLQQARTHFGRQPTSCWDAHAWNPTSDHPKGRGCDVTFGTAGRFPDEADKAAGWTFATWLVTNAKALHVAYVIWQGRIWSTARADEGWRTYTGGGVYDPTSPVGGHYDHVHVSVLP